MPVRVMKLIGVETLIATNAGGGLNNMFTVNANQYLLTVRRKLLKTFVMMLIIFGLGRGHHDDKGPHQPAWVLLSASPER